MRGNVQKSPSSKAAALLTRGAYMKCVSANAAKSGTSVSPKVGKTARTPLAAFFNIPFDMLRDRRGVTLTELMVTLVMGLATVAAVYSIHLVQVNQRILQEEVLAMQQNARAAMDLMIRELRMAGYDPMGMNRDGTNSNDFPGVAYHPTELHIQSDLDGNGLLTDSNESIVFLYDSSTSTLRRKVGRGGRQPVAEHIQSLAIGYFDEHGMLTTDSKAIRMVELILTARTEHPDSSYSGNDGFRTFTVRSRVLLRNLQ